MKMKASKKIPTSTQNKKSSSLYLDVEMGLNDFLYQCGHFLACILVHEMISLHLSSEILG